MNETSKAYARLQSDSLWLQHVRNAPRPWLDVGAGDDCLPSAEPYDKAQGDATELKQIPDNTCGLVWSSHCLEHVGDPVTALENWWRVIMPGGWLWLLVPDALLYEKGQWPSRYNGDHKHRFSTFRSSLIGARDHFNLVGFLGIVQSTFTDAELWRLQLVDRHYDYSRPDSDQTLGMAECSCEMVLRKVVP